MAEQLLSPGQLLTETDLSLIPNRPVAVGAAVIGPTAKGPIVPTVVTSFADFTSKYGTTVMSGSDVYSFFTTALVQNYFQNRGESLLIARVVSGSYTEATSSLITNATGTQVFELETISVGNIMNSDSTELPGGILPSGSDDNFRYQISNVNVNNGTFNVIIRKGNDTTNSPVILETFNNVSLDPLSSRFITRVIGDEKQSYNPTTNQVEISGNFANGSRYVRVKSVNILTPNYLDSNGQPISSYTASLPTVQSGTFGGATGQLGQANFYENISNTNSQGLKASNYSNMINLLSNKDDYKFNSIFTPGLIYSFASHSSVMNTLISNIEKRGDSIYVADLVDFSSNENDAVQQAALIDSSYVATYFPWLLYNDSNAKRRINIPASTVIAGVFSFTDSISNPWFAPAGMSRGSLPNVVRPVIKLNQSSRDTLYVGKVNPIASIPSQPISILGNKTLQTKPTSLNRVNTRRLLIELKEQIGKFALDLLFENNSQALRNQFLGKANPYLESVKQREGLIAYKVIMDDTNNTNETIDQNILVGKIFVQPAKSIEFIYIDFTITPTGVSF